MEASPALHIQRLSPEAREQDILNFLGGFNFRGSEATSAVAPFSGGEKARLALAMVVWQRPNLLVLDEPTNHLDLDMRHAMEVALQSYQGALVLVSHDRHMLRNSVEQLLLVHDGTVEEYGDDLEGYERWILSSFRGPEKTPAASSEDTRKGKRQQAAALRERLRPLKNSVQKTEREMARAESELEQVQQRLADSDIYSEQRKDELAQLLLREGELKAHCQELEDSWLEQQQELEELEGM
jgi:ATP-binding cassette subfamily F protein 3